jgi:hypothetical protein
MKNKTDNNLNIKISMLVIVKMLGNEISTAKGYRLLSKLLDEINKL